MMLQGVSGSGYLSAAQLSGLFKKSDSDNDGQVTRAEFIASAPSDVTGDQAATLFDTLDSESSGTLTQANFVSAFQRLAEQLQAMLIQAQEEGGRMPPPPPDSSGLFSRLDADGDGVVSREEFVAGRPDDVSEEQAGLLFDKIAGDSTTGLSEDEFVTGMENARPDGPPPAGVGELASAEDAALEDLLSALLSESSETESLYTANQVISQLLMAINSYEKSMLLNPTSALGATTSDV